MHVEVHYCITRLYKFQELLPLLELSFHQTTILLAISLELCLGNAQHNKQRIYILSMSSYMYTCCIN